MNDELYTENKILWSPDATSVFQSNLTDFTNQVNHTFGLSITHYADLHDWSVTHSADFWSTLWSYSNVIGDKGEAPYVENAELMPGAQWFPKSSLNFAENLLSRRDDKTALVFYGENQVRNEMTYRVLYASVSILTQKLIEMGVKQGDRVAGLMPNMPETIIAMLATSALGAIWTSCSPDFGVQGVLDRFGQTEPKVLFGVDGYYYNEKKHSINDKMIQISQSLPSVKNIVLCDYIHSEDSTDDITNCIHWSTLFSDSDLVVNEIDFVRVPFNHPLYILYSSGTTGQPKCIVHGVGGTLLQHKKEHLLHCDLKEEDVLFYFTTCGWMMWNWLVSGLATECTLILYDGSPFIEEGKTLWQIAEDEKISVFGTSAKYLDALKQTERIPNDEYTLTELRLMLSTGSPLVPETFDFVYEKIKSNLCLSSISGGTDIVSCFALGNPTLPVRRGELQCIGLGLGVEVLDDEGQLLPPGEKGELTCANSFPCMPVGFWNDSGEKYHAAYFDKFPDRWSHGDYVTTTDTGGLIIFGRSDTVLNPGGVRIGTAEIYRQAEQISEVQESIVIGQSWKGDTRVVLFVVLHDDAILDEELMKKIRHQIRTNTTVRHVPEKIVCVKDIPRTKSGKIVELAVKQVVHGETVKNIESLANPEALAYFKDIADLSV